MIRLARIIVYPIKSLDGADLPSTNVLASGALENDRRYAIVDSDNRFINGKRTATIHQVRTSWNVSADSFQLSVENKNPSEPFDLTAELDSPGAWLSDAFEQPCQLIENPLRGFPDDTDSPGPTVISTKSLQAIASWFDLTIEEVRRRFRANLEIDAPYAFWEDQLVGQKFSVGDVTLQATGVCQRCVVPSRDSRTGKPTSAFQKLFAIQREATLPSQSPRQAFNHFYRAALNTQLVGPAGTIAVGNLVQ